jgi:thioredoxin reductase
MAGREESVDVVVIGGGPAGLTAALVLGRSRRSVAVLDLEQPRHAVARGVRNLITRDGMSPAEFRRVAWEQMSPYASVERSLTEVVALRRDSEMWLTECKDGSTWRSLCVILAVGVEDEYPEILGLDDLRGRCVFSCPYCHGWEVRDRPLAVIAGNSGALELAPLLLGWSQHVLLCTHGEILDIDIERRLAEFQVAVSTAKIAELRATDRNLSAIEFVDGTSHPCEALFVKPRQRLPQLVADLRLVLDDEVRVRVDDTGLASAPRLWVAGDACSSRQQVVEASAQGVRVAMAVNRVLAFQSIAPRPQ